MHTLDNIILGCIFLDEKKDYINLDELEAKFFSDQRLFQKVVEYRKNNFPYDLLIARKHFSVNELVLLESYIRGIGTICRYEYYYTELRREKYEIEIGQQILAGKIDVETIKKYISLIGGVNASRNMYDFDGDLLNYLDDFDKRLSGSYERYSVGMQGFDDIIGALRPKMFLTIGANSGGCKTNLMLKMMLNLMGQNIPCLYITSEMGYGELVERMGAISSGLRLFDIRNAHLKPEHITEYVEGLKKYIAGKKSFVCEQSKFNTAKIKDFIDRTKVKFIFVDYLQKFDLETGKNTSRAAVMSDIVNDLKSIAMEKNVVIVGASQLKQNANRHSAGLVDLKESGGIEEASDIVILLSSLGSDDNFMKIKVDIGKNRHGITDQFVYILNRKNCDMEYSYADTDFLKKKS